ncbi:unnamed protein product, partial [Rotaria sp. Silwood1]
MQLNGR